MADSSTTDAGSNAPFPLPRVTIKFCTQCKWNLRAAYFAQELLSTFSTSLGEVALQPSTGGTFIVEIFHQASSPSSSSTNTQPPIPSHPHIASTILWDRSHDGGFPETKELKRRVRDVIEPGRNLGHVDRDHPKPTAAAAGAPAPAETAEKELPSRKELEAAGPAGAGYPGASEAAAVLVGDLEGKKKQEVCEDC